MSREGVAAFLTRIMDDEAFRGQLKANPEATLAQFDLTPDEVTAIKSADPSKIQELGVDERVSKTATSDWFTWTDSSTFGATQDQLIAVLRLIFHP